MVRDRVEEKGWQHLSDISLLAIFSGFDWITGLMEAPALETQLDANSFASPVPLNFTPDAPFLPQRSQCPGKWLGTGTGICWITHPNLQTPGYNVDNILGSSQEN